jgi:pyrroloquinoline quinone biosynthesis protein B
MDRGTEGAAMLRREIFRILAAGWTARLGIRTASSRFGPAGGRGFPPQLDGFPSVRAMVLGTAQDGGIPHLGCRCVHCEEARRDPGRARLVASLALADLSERKLFLVDASPDVRTQLDRALGLFPPPLPKLSEVLAGVLLTHAHIGHYLGLAFFGYESVSTEELPVHCSRRMAAFLAGNGPWSQLVRLKNIALRTFKPGDRIPLTASLSAEPFRVPHRDEYTDTMGFRIAGPTRALLYIPDIKGWDAWERSLGDALREADVALLDGTFFGPDDLAGRDMSTIGHPLIVDTLRRLGDLPAADRPKILFTHLNHTNPALDPASAARRTIEDAGARLAEDGETIDLARPTKSG